MGVYFAADRLTLTTVGATPTGTAVVARSQEELDGRNLSKVLADMLEAHLTLRQRRRLPVCLGVSSERTFFSTSPAPDTQGKELTMADVISACEIGSISEADNAADYVKTRLRGGSVCSVAVCKRDLAQELLDAVQKANVRNSRLEPAPWSILQAADKQGKPPKKWKTIIRVLLGSGGEALAILSLNNQPMLWRRFTMSQGAEARIIASAARCLQVYALRRINVRHINGIVLQGPAARELADKVGAYMNMNAVGVDGAGLTDEAYSVGLALSAKKAQDGGMDMLRTLKPAPGIKEIFPWKMVAFVLMVIVGVGLTLWDKSKAVADEYRGLRLRNASHAWACNLPTRQIQIERKNLGLEVGCVERFLSTRVIWSDYLRDLPSRLPLNMCLSSIWATAEMKAMGKKKHKIRVNRSLTLRGMTRFADREAAPKEIDAFLESLRNVETLQRDFPIVTLAEIKWRKEGGRTVAMFTIVALPKTKKGAPGK